MELRMLDTMPDPRPQINALADMVGLLLSVLNEDDRAIMRVLLDAASEYRKDNPRYPTEDQQEFERLRAHILKMSDLYGRSATNLRKDLAVQNRAALRAAGPQLRPVPNEHAEDDPDAP
jgi:hypothetical protein